MTPDCAKFEHTRLAFTMEHILQTIRRAKSLNIIAQRTQAVTKCVQKKGITLNFRAMDLTQSAGMGTARFEMRSAAEKRSWYVSSGNVSRCGRRVSSRRCNKRSTGSTTLSAHGGG